LEEDHRAAETPYKNPRIKEVSLIFVTLKREQGGLVFGEPYVMSDMKMLFDFNRHAGWQPKASVVRLAFVLTIAIGCGKSNAPTTSAAPPPDTASVSSTPNPQVAASTQPVTVTNSDVPKEEMQAMNRALLAWTRANNRRPKTFQEFAGSTDFQIPSPPLGKKYAFDGRGFIVLVDAASN
jgi:hypothetical protein